MDATREAADLDLLSRFGLRLAPGEVDVVRLLRLVGVVVGVVIHVANRVQPRLQKECMGGVQLGTECERAREGERKGETTGCGTSEDDG